MMLATQKSQISGYFGSLTLFSMCLPYTKCLRVMADVFTSATAQPCDLVRNTVPGHVSGSI